jgi:hypothetical protein
LNSSELVSVFLPSWTMFDAPPVAICSEQSSEATFNDGSFHLIFIDALWRRFWFIADACSSTAPKASSSEQYCPAVCCTFCKWYMDSNSTSITLVAFGSIIHDGPRNLDELGVRGIVI